MGLELLSRDDLLRKIDIGFWSANAEIMPWSEVRKSNLRIHSTSPSTMHQRLGGGSPLRIGES